MSDVVIWMSFADEDSGQSLGVAIVAVSDMDILAAKIEVDVLYPNHGKGAEVPFAAVRKAHQLKINPGGQVLCAVMDADEIPADCIGRLMTKPELIERGLI